MHLIIGCKVIGKQGCICTIRRGFAQTEINAPPSAKDSVPQDSPSNHLPPAKAGLSVQTLTPTKAN